MNEPANHEELLENQEKTVVDTLLDYLKAEGIKVVFGIPGGLILPFFDAVDQDRDLELIVTRHEESAAFMADGYARTTGQIAVCASTAGPGSTNLLTGVACAFADSVPMLVITGQVPEKKFGKGAAQETAREDIDIVAMFAPITKYSSMVTGPENLGHHYRRAMRAAFSGRPGPVHLNIPVDLWGETVVEQWLEPSTYRTDNDLFSEHSVAQAADALLEAKHPVILVGSGTQISGAEEHVLALAEKLSAKVATTPRAKGVFPEDHPLSLGVLGIAGHFEARHVILEGQTDTLITIGASLGETTTMNWHPDFALGKTLIQLDICPDRIGRNYPVNIPLLGDARTILQKLLERMADTLEQGGTIASAWDSFVDSAQNDPKPSYLPSAQDTPRLLAPKEWRAELNALMPHNAVVFSDIGAHMFFNLHHLVIKQEQQFILNLGFGSMGHGTTAPMGAAVAHQDRPIISIVGDACFLMNGMELVTAHEYDLSVIWIVENNNMHGITWFGSRGVGKKRPLDAVKYNHPLEVAAIAKAMGLSTWRVDAPGDFSLAFQDALAQGGPCVIEVRVDESTPPPLGKSNEPIAGFVEK